MEATVTADATGDEQIKGTVTRVVRVKSQGTTGSDGARLLPVVIPLRSRSTIRNF